MQVHKHVCTYMQSHMPSQACLNVHQQACASRHILLHTLVHQIHILIHICLYLNKWLLLLLLLLFVCVCVFNTKVYTVWVLCMFDYLCMYFSYSWVHVCFYLTWFYMSLLHTIAGVEAVGKEEQGNTQEKHTGKRTWWWLELNINLRDVSFYFSHFFPLVCVCVCFIQRNKCETDNVLPMYIDITCGLVLKGILELFQSENRKQQASCRWHHKFLHSIFLKFHCQQKRVLIFRIKGILFEENTFLDRNEQWKFTFWKQIIVWQERNLHLQTQDEEDMAKRVDHLTKSTIAKAAQRKEMGIFHESLVQHFLLDCCCFQLLSFLNPCLFILCFYSFTIPK